MPGAGHDVLVGWVGSEAGPVLGLQGRLDRRSAPDLRQELYRAVDQGTGPLNLDLSQCTIADAAAIGLLIECLRRSHRSGRSVHVVAADPRTQRLLRRARLSRLLVDADRVPTPA